MKLKLNQVDISVDYAFIHHLSLSLSLGHLINIFCVYFFLDKCTM